MYFVLFWLVLMMQDDGQRVYVFNLFIRNEDAFLWHWLQP